MTDTEIIKACAKALGYKLLLEGEQCYEGFSVTRDCWITGPESFIACYTYDPLRHDDQAMALVKKLKINLERETSTHSRWIAYPDWSTSTMSSRNYNLNRAICECAVKMMKAFHDD